MNGSDAIPAAAIKEVREHPSGKRLFPLPPGSEHRFTTIPDLDLDSQTFPEPIETNGDPVPTPPEVKPDMAQM